MATLKLLPNEKLVHQANPHVIFLILPITGLIFFWLILWLGSCSTLEVFSLKSFCHFFTSLVIFFAISVIYLDWHFNRLYLTNYRVIKERGIIGKRFVSIWLDEIQDLTVEFGIMGRILGFGNLIIESAGTYGQVSFKGFPNPRNIKTLIEGRIQKVL